MSDLERKFNSKYHVLCNRKGEVFSIDGNPLKVRVINGYPHLVYRDPVLKRYRGVTLAKLIADTFLPFGLPNDIEMSFEDEFDFSRFYVVLHKDGDIMNNHADNLYWGTRSDAKRQGWKFKHDGKREYRPRFGSIFYAAKTIAALESGHPLRFENTKDLNLAGFNTGRVYTSAKYGRKYKGFFWKVIAKSGKPY